MARDGAGWRRAVPSPEPQAVVELISFARLLEKHTTLICGEGRPRGGGCAGALDRRRSSDRQGSPHVPLLGITLHADRLLIRTDVSSVMLDYGTPTQSALRHADLDELAGMSFPASRCDPRLRPVDALSRRPACRPRSGPSTMPGGFCSGDTGTQITGPAAPQTDPRRAAGFSSR